MFYTMLRKSVTNHLLAGIALSIAIVSAVAFHNYRQSLLETADRFDALRVNMRKMGIESALMLAVMKKVDSLLPIEYSAKSHREIMLLTLDSLKADFPGGDISVSKFAELDPELSLPVSISVPVTDWTQMLESIAYLQALNFPEFIIKSVAIEKTETKTASGILTCKIEGRLSMPVERLKD